MKIISKYIFITSILVSGLLSSCGDWLDVKSKSEVEPELLFSTVDGYYNAITGIYVTMGASALYGGDIALSALEPLSAQYNVSNNRPERQAWTQYKYTEKTAQSTINNIWLGLYNSIANCNLLLENLVAPKSTFDAGMPEILRAEALGLRAYMYFDLVRMFNKAPAVDPASDNVPYKTVYGSKIGERLKTKDLLARVDNDLVQAQQLLKQYDPIIAQRSYSDYYMQLSRQRRMNYYAVTALRARIALYVEDYRKAYENARIVIESNKFSFISPGTMVDKDIYGNENTADRECSQELLFGLNNDNITLVSRSTYESLVEDFVKSLNCYQGGSDVRLDWFYKNPTASNKIQLVKYKRPSNAQQAADYPTAVTPMLKLSEMYLIAEEALAADATLTGDRLSMINEFKAARQASPTATAANLADEITHEYICEFKGEGQLFLYYKRKNLAKIDNGMYNGNKNDINIESYTFPRPQNEEDFGNQ